MTTDVFLSVGQTFTDEQEAVVLELEQLLRSRGMAPRTVGRSDFSSGAPLLRIKEVMDECRGTLVLALERTQTDKLINRPGGAEEVALLDVRMPTVWNQIEAAMSYARGLPILVVVQKGLKNEGLLEKGYDWYVKEVALNTESLRTDEFLAILDDWIRRVDARRGSTPERASSKPSATEYTLAQIASSLTIPQLWAALGSIASILTVVAAVAYKVGGG